MARPSKASEWLEPDNLLLIEGWARDGLTDKQIAKNIGISEHTFVEWKKKFPSLVQSLKKGKEVTDYEVTNALYRAAISGNVTAMIFWLKNRRPDKWREKPVEVFADEATETIDELSKSLMQLAEEMESGDNSD